MSTIIMENSIAILDFGSQFAQLIARRVREAQVYCELFPWDAPEEQIMALEPKGFILSGGPNSAYEPGAPFIPDFVLASAKPILGKEALSLRKRKTPKKESGKKSSKGAGMMMGESMTK